MLELIEKIDPDGPADDTISLPFALRQRSRQRVRLDGGRDAAVVLPPSTPLFDGDRLRARDGTAVRVRAAAEEVSTGRTDDPFRLARACYHLGNRHATLQIGRGFIRWQPDHVLDDMVRGLGLTVTHETTTFEPERGAYQSAPHHGQAHDPHDGHAHSSAPDGGHRH